MIYSNLACGKCKIGGVDDKGEHYGLGQIQKKLYDKDEHGLRQIQKKLYDKDEHGLRQIEKNYVTKMNMALAHAM
jgi:hypothetical protein